MNYNLVFTIYGLVFTILLLITLFLKKRKSTIRTKIYTLIIIVLLIYSISEIVSLFSLFYFPDKPGLGVNFKNINNNLWINLFNNSNNIFHFIRRYYCIHNCKRF